MYDIHATVWVWTCCWRLAARRRRRRRAAVLAIYVYINNIYIYTIYIQMYIHNICNNDMYYIHIMYVTCRYTQIHNTYTTVWVQTCCWRLAARKTRRRRAAGHAPAAPASAPGIDQPSKSNESSQSPNEWSQSPPCRPCQREEPFC